MENLYYLCGGVSLICGILLLYTSMGALFGLLDDYDAKRKRRKVIYIVVIPAIILVLAVTGFCIVPHVQDINIKSTVYFDNLTTDLTISGKILTAEDAASYKNELSVLTKKQIKSKNIFSLDDLEELSEEIKERFNSHHQEARIKFLDIKIFYPKALQEATEEIAKQKLLIRRDSLISAAAKRDAEGYTPTAERLEERRDNRQLNIERLKSNERIADRKAQALENAADNVGAFRSVSLTQ